MTTVPNLNVVVQQGSTAIEAQTLKSQMQNAQQMETIVVRHDEVKQTTVPKTDPSEGKILERDRFRRKRIRYEMKKRKKKDRKPAPEKHPESPGRLVDTVA